MVKVGRCGYGRGVVYGSDLIVIGGLYYIEKLCWIFVVVWCVDESGW